MTQVNLLPPDVRERQRTRRATAAVIAVGVVVMAILGGVFVVQSGRLDKANQDLEAQRATNSSLQLQIAHLTKFRDLKTQLQERQALVDSLQQGEVEWSGVLRDVSSVIPSDMWLTSITGQVGGAGATTASASAPGSNIIGNIQFQGNAFDHPTIALWLTRLEQVNGWVNAWVSSATKTDVEGQQVVQFTGSVDLTVDAERGGPQ